MSTKTKTLSCNFPQVVEADDYHDFQFIESALNQIFSEAIKVEEIGFNYKTGMYEGVAYSGRSAERFKNKRHKELKLIEMTHDMECNFSVFLGGSSTTEALFEFVANSMKYDELLSQCSHEKECKNVILLMQNHLALGTAKRMVKQFLLEEGYGQEDIDAYKIG